MLAQYSVFAVYVPLAALADPYLIPGMYVGGLIAVNRVCAQITTWGDCCGQNGVVISRDRSC